MSTRRLLVENIVSLGALQALNYAAPLITLPYLVHVLQPAHFGLLSFAQGIVIYFDLFTDFGFNFSQSRAIAACRHRPEALSRVFWSTIYAKALLMCTSAVAMTLLVAFTPKLRATPQLFAVNFLYVVGTTFFPIWLFQGLERMKLAATLFGSARLLTIPALFLFVRHPQDYVVAGAIQASVELTASVFAWPLILGQMRLRWSSPRVAEIRYTLERAWPLFLTTSVVQLCTSGSIAVLGFAAGKNEVGYFSAADKLVKASAAAVAPLGQALYPHITAAKLRSPRLALKLIRKSLYVTGIISMALTIVTAIWARPVCHMIFGGAFEHSVVVLRWLSPLPILYGLTTVLGMQTMIVFEMDAILSRITLVSGLISLPIMIVLSRAFGAVGAAAASVLTAALMAAAMCLALHIKGMHVWKHSESLEPLLSDTAA